MSILRDLAIFTKAFTNILIKVSNKEKLFTLSFLGEIVVALGSAQQITKQVEDDSVGKNLSEIHQYFTASGEGQEPAGWLDSIWFLQRLLFKGIYDLKLFFDSMQSSAQLVQSISHNGKEEIDAQASNVGTSALYLSTTNETKPTAASPAIAPYADAKDKTAKESPAATQEVLESKNSAEIAGHGIDKRGQEQKDAPLTASSSNLLRAAEQDHSYTASTPSNHKPSEQQKPGGAVLVGATVGLMAGASTIKTDDIPAPDTDERSSGLERPTLEELSGISKPPIQSPETAVADLETLAEGNEAGDESGAYEILGIGSEKLTITDGDTDIVPGVGSSEIPLTGGDNVGFIPTTLSADIEILDAADGCGCSPTDLTEVCLPLCAIL